jgi:hypothetical protein
MADAAELYDALLAERGGHDALSLVERAVARRLAQALGDDGNRTDIAALAAMLPPAVKRAGPDKLTVEFVSPIENRAWNLDLLDDEELLSFEACARKALGAGQPRRLSAALDLCRALDRAEAETGEPLKDTVVGELSMAVKAKLMNALTDVTGSSHVVHALYGFGDAAQLRAELEVLRGDLEKAKDELAAAKGTSPAAVVSLAERRAAAERAAPIMQCGSDLAQLNQMLTASNSGTPDVWGFPPGW